MNNYTNNNGLGGGSTDNYRGQREYMNPPPPRDIGGRGSYRGEENNRMNNTGVRRRRSRSTSRDREYRGTRQYTDSSNPNISSYPPSDDHHHHSLPPSSSNTRYPASNKGSSSSGRLINIRERPFDHGIIEGSAVIAEISPALTFPIWLEKNRSEGKLALDVAPSKAAEEYAVYKATYNVNSTEAFYKAHRHEEWFRQRYDPVVLIQYRDQRIKDSQTNAEEYLQAIDNGTVVHILPTLGGDYTGKHGLGIGLQQALRSKDSLSNITMGTMGSEISSSSSSLSTPSPLPTQIPVLFIRGISALVPTHDIHQAIETCSHLVRKYNVGIDNLGTTGGLTVPSFTNPTYEDMEKAILQASNELLDLLPSSIDTVASSRTANEQLDGSGDGTTTINDDDGQSTKRQRLDESNTGSTDTFSASKPSRTALLHSLGYDEDSLRSYFNLNANDKTFRVPKPVRIELSDSRRLPGASYRRNVWVEYSNLQDAAVAKQLCRKLTMEVIGGSDPVASLTELNKIKTLARACNVPDTTGTGTTNPEENPGTAILESINIYKVKLNDAVPELPLYLTKGSIVSAEWHQPMYGTVKQGNTNLVRKGKGRNNNNPDNDMNLAYAILRGYPYGKKHTCEIPSWASIPEQISTDLPRALELAALLDEEFTIFGTTITNDTNSSMDTSISTNTSSIVSNAPNVPAEVQLSTLYRHLYGNNRGVMLHNYSLLQQLDIVINYLRYVHYYDYYSGIQGTSAGDLRQAVGDGYLRTGLPKNVHHARNLHSSINTTGTHVVSSTLSTVTSSSSTKTVTSSSPSITDTPVDNKDDIQPAEESVANIDVAEAYNELLYGQTSTDETTENTAEGTNESSSSSSTTLTPATPSTLTQHNDSTNDTPLLVDSVSSMSIAARSAYNAWSLKVTQIYRGRSMQARRQIDANKNGSTAVKTEKALEDLVSSTETSTLPSLSSTNDTDDDTKEISQPTLSTSNTLILSSSSSTVNKPSSKDNLIPSTPVLSRGSNPIPWVLIQQHANAIRQTKERILASLSEGFLLGEYYAACIDDSPVRLDTTTSSPNPETIPDVRRTETPFIVSLVKNMNDSSLNSSSKCILCKKSFKANYYTVKHLMNKHPNETNLALETVKQMIDTSLTLCLSDSWFMRRYFFSDSRRPIPWHEPSTLKNLETDNNASIQRLTMQGVSLPHFATALGSAVAEVSGLALPKGNRSNNTSMVPFGMLPSPFLSMFSMNPPNNRGGNILNNSNNPNNHTNNNNTNNRYNRQGQRNSNNNNPMNAGLLGTGPNNNNPSMGGRFQRSNNNNNQPPLPPMGGPMYRDKDAPRSTTVVNLPKPNYGTAIVSYDDI